MEPLSASSHKIIGIIGDGQLALMLAQAAKQLNINTLCYGQNTNSPASKITEVIVGSFDDHQKFSSFLDLVDIVTYETENLEVKNIEPYIKHKTLYPSLEILKLTQNRLYEKQMLSDLHIPTTEYAAIKSYQDLLKYSEIFDYKCILKTALFGYDGKGQYIIKSKQDVKSAWEALADQQLILEKLVNFDFEVSIIATRDSNNKIKFYPLTKNTHHQGILRLSEAPYNSPELQQAQDIITKILEKFNYIGTLCVELFAVSNKLLVNEIAPRVHNSGHWTIEGSATSQFSNHIRALAGLELGDTDYKSHNAMINCISEMPCNSKTSNIGNVYFHDYFKAPRPNRKLGHITLSTDDNNEYKQTIAKLKNLFNMDIYEEA